MISYELAGYITAVTALLVFAGGCMVGVILTNWQNERKLRTALDHGLLVVPGKGVYNIVKRGRIIDEPVAEDDPLDWATKSA